MKQEALADKLGVSQQTVSRMEQNEDVDDAMLEKVAKVLGVTPESIKNYSAEATMYYIQNNYDGSSVNSSPVNAFQCTFNDYLLDENKRLNSEIKDLNTALLKEKDEKIAFLQKLLGEKGK
jgi:transcriptional regulator with XRE-family HTH domain